MFEGTSVPAIVAVPQYQPRVKVVRLDEQPTSRILPTRTAGVIDMDLLTGRWDGRPLFPHFQLDISCGWHD